MLPLKVLSEADAMQELRDMIADFDLNDLAHMCSELTCYAGLRIVVRMGSVASDAWVDGQCLAMHQEEQGHDL